MLRTEELRMEIFHKKEGGLFGQNDENRMQELFFSYQKPFFGLK